MNKYCQLILLTVFITLNIPGTLYARQLQFGHFGVDDGLSQGVVLSILQDSQGFMWFCTEDGLNKYDGYDFTVYKHEPENPNSLSSSHVWDVYEEQDTHILWIATSNGFDRLDLQTGQFKHYRHDENDPYSLSSNDVRAIHEDHTGTLWIATWGGGLNTFDRKKERFTFAHSARECINRRMAEFPGSRRTRGLKGHSLQPGALPAGMTVNCSLLFSGKVMMAA